MYLGSEFCIPVATYAPKPAAPKPAGLQPSKSVRDVIGSVRDRAVARGLLWDCSILIPGHRFRGGGVLFLKSLAKGGDDESDQNADHGRHEGQDPDISHPSCIQDGQ